MENHDLAAGELPFDAAILAMVRNAFDDSSPVIVELRLGRDDDTPERLIFHRYDMFVAYLRMIARPGDAISAWRFDEVCRADNALLASRELSAP